MFNKLEFLDKVTDCVDFDSNNASFKDDFSLTGWELLWPTYTNLKSLSAPVMKIRKAVQNVELWVTQNHRQCHSSIKRVLLPIQLLTESMRLYIFYRLRDIASHCRKSPIFTYHTCIWCRRMGCSSVL